MKYMSLLHIFLTNQIIELAANTWGKHTILRIIKNSMLYKSTERVRVKKDIKPHQLNHIA